MKISVVMPVFNERDTVAEIIGRVQRACEDRGRDPSSLVYSAAVNVDIRANSADKVVDELSQFKAAGAQRLYLQLLDNADVDQVRVIAREVKPHL